MTARQGYNRILSAEALQSLSVCSSARSAHLAKAQPSLRVGAGGVGGLVAVSVDGDFYFPGYDNNGNVIGYWDESGSIVAEYAYDAFGNTISSSGSMASVFPHRFSTKYYDAETDLYYYGYRYYSPSLGRWISRDPIEENGGMNLFAFCVNNPLSKTDSFGARVNVFSTSADSELLDENSADSIVHKSIDGGKELLQKFRADVMSAKDSDFDELVRCGRVLFNGEKFKDTKMNYIALIDWELSSKHVTLHGDGLWINELRRNVQNTSLVPAKNYDWLVVVSHGNISDPDMALLGDSYQPREMIEANAASMIRISFQGKVAFVSCFRDWKTADNLEDTTAGFTVGLRRDPSAQPYKGKWYRFGFYSFVPYLQIGTTPLRPME